MSKFMRPETALQRLVEDDHAPAKSRCEALRQLKNPPINMLRRMLARTAKRKKPLPARLRALAALRYAEIMKAKQLNREVRNAVTPLGPMNDIVKPRPTQPNALGI